MSGTTNTDFVGAILTLVWFLMLAGGIGLMLGFRLPRRAPKPPPPIQVIETKAYTTGGPSHTMRLIWRLYPEELHNGSIHPGFIHAQYSPEQPKVYVFATFRGKAYTFEDDLNMFPSDALVAAIRLVK